MDKTQAKLSREPQESKAIRRNENNRGSNQKDLARNGHHTSSNCDF